METDRRSPQSLMLVLCVTWACFLHGPIQAQETFSKVYSISGMGGIAEIPGSNGFLVCRTERYGLGDIDGFSFFHLDTAGAIIDSHYYSTGPLYNILQGGAIPLVRSDGSFSFLFGSHPNILFKESIRVFNTSPDGVMNWNRKIEFESSDLGITLNGQRFFETPDGGYLIQATRTRMEGGALNRSGPVVFKLDASGNVIWNKGYAVTEPCSFRNLCAMDPSGEILLGFNSHHQCGTNVNDSYITKIGIDGNTLWSKRIAGLRGGMADCVRYDDGYLLVANDSTEYCLIKISTSGDLMWTRSYFLSSGKFWAAQRIDASGTGDDGAVLLSGVSPIAGATLSDLILIKIDANGALLWKDYFNDATLQFSGDLLESSDGALIQLSHEALPNGWPSQTFLRKITSDGFSPCIWDSGPDLVEGVLDVELSDVSLSEFDTLFLSTPLYVGDTTWWATTQWMSVCYLSTEEVNLEEQPLIIPNPFSETAIIKLDRDIPNATLLVYDALGCELRRLELSSRNTTLSRAGLSDGIYLYRVLCNGVAVHSGKFVIE